MPRKRRPSELAPDGLYDRILRYQDGHCGIIGCTASPGTRRFHLDHDHATNEWRGALCHGHNRRLWKGATPAELRAMADYLEGPRLWGKLP